MIRQNSQMQSRVTTAKKEVRSLTLNFNVANGNSISSLKNTLAPKTNKQTNSYNNIRVIPLKRHENQLIKRVIVSKESVTFFRKQCKVFGRGRESHKRLRNNLEMSKFTDNVRKYSLCLCRLRDILERNYTMRITDWSLTSCIH